MLETFGKSFNSCRALGSGESLGKTYKAPFQNVGKGMESLGRAEKLVSFLVRLPEREGVRSLPQFDLSLNLLENFAIKEE